ncbi:uncharacterized protein LOC116408764 [Xenopus tropicalis]|uniref:Uncharacterized protein LOC116408764 n=1 Tax=Xenopus tropicalis TaxID=8364 RepID=A0A8J1J3P2_XENTR|nr:uncharacterized protein LOC116408764 [Xenopus tropicalis]
MYPNGTKGTKEIHQTPGMPSVVNDTKEDLKYILPVALMLSMVAIPLLCFIAWLVYVKCMRTKQTDKDVENPPVQPEEKSSKTPESSDSFFRCLWKKIMEKIRKKKPKLPDVENPPETAQSEQKLKAAKSFFRCLCKKIMEKIRKKKPKLPDVENPPETAQSAQKLKAAKSSVHKGKQQKKKKKKVAKKTELPVAAQSEAASESPDSREHREQVEKIEEPTEVEKIEDHIEQRLPEPESGALVPINTFSFLESLVTLNEKPTKNQKRKKVQRSMKIEEILESKEDTEGLLQRLMELKSKSPTAQNLNM